MQKRKFSLKNKIINMADSNDIFSTSSIIKKLFILIMFFFQFAMITIILFKINNIEKDLSKYLVYSWYISILGLSWYIFRISSTNLYKSYTSIYTSYVLAVGINVLMALFVFYVSSLKVSTPGDLFKIKWWVVAVMGYDVLWKAILSLSEYRSRPIFSFESMFSAISQSIIIGIIVLFTRFTRLYLINRKIANFDYLEPWNLFSIYYMVFALVSLLVIGIIYMKKFKYFAKEYLKISKVIKIMAALLVIGPITIWFTSVAGEYFEWSTQIIIFIALSGFLIIILILFLFKSGELSKYSNTYLLLISTSLLLLVSYQAFIIIWWKSSIISMTIILLFAIFAINIINVFAMPAIPKLYAPLFIITIKSIAIYTVLMWIAQRFVDSWFKELPFNFGEILFLLILVMTIALEGVIVSAVRWRISRISKYAHKANKKIVQKGVQNG